MNLSALVTVFGVRGASPAAITRSITSAGLERQDRLPLGRAVGRLAHADVGAHADRLRALEIVDVHDLAAVEDREMDGLVDLLAQVVEVGPRLVGDVHAPAHQRAEPEQRDAELVLAVLAVLLEQALRDQGRRQPMHGALGQAEPPRQLADADLDLVLGERLEQPDRGGDRRQPLALRRAPRSCRLLSCLPSGLGSTAARVPLRGPLFQNPRRANAAVSM